MTEWKKNFVNKIIIDHKKDFIKYLYFILSEILKLDLQAWKLRKKISVINIYDNQIKVNYILNYIISYSRKSLVNMN